MKEKKNGQRLYLQKRNNRWKWMAGATVATAAGVTASQAYGITINLVNNYISAAGGNHLNADLTGDGHPDFTLAHAYHRLSFLFPPSTGFARFYARLTLNGVAAVASRRNSNIPDSGHERLGSRTAYFCRCGTTYNGTFTHYGTYSLTGSIPLFFKDLHINDGAPTMGSLQVTVSTSGYNSAYSGDALIQLDSFTYNSNTPTPPQVSHPAVPDQGWSLALLAMGAGGVVAFRRWRTAQGRS